MLFGCLEVRFGAVDGGAGGSASGAGGAGAGPSSVGGAGGAGGGPCVPSEELCNGLDDDCDGIADEPDSGAGDLCGCTWLTLGERLYAACDSSGDFDRLRCPTGMDLVVLGSAEEQAALFVLVPVPDTAAFLGLRQDDDASHPAVGWRWVGREGDAWVTRDGAAPLWGLDQPNDRAHLVETEPVSLEDGQENCGFLYRAPDGSESLTDGACVGPAVTRVLCEQQPDDCISGAPCRGALGCPGVMDCSRAEGERCVPSARQAELCNGFDDDCDGVLDDEVCDCTSFSDPATGRSYKLCTTEVLIEDAACGPGYRLAAPNSDAELALLADQDLGFLGHHLGIVQPLGSSAVDVGWTLLDGTPIPPAWWSSGEPNDSDVEAPIEEAGVENCARLLDAGLYDNGCTSDPRGFLCEEIP
jgi:hypothetical protein